MTNEQFVRQAYAIAEVRDIPAWVDCFNPDGVFVDESVGVSYRGPDEVAKPVENYGGAFSRRRETGWTPLVATSSSSRTGGFSSSTVTRREP
jgi:hypothetical protein